MNWAIPVGRGRCLRKQRSTRRRGRRLWTCCATWTRTRTGAECDDRAASEGIDRARCLYCGPLRGPMARPIYRNLTVQVLCAIALGLAIGAARPDWGVALKPLADGFIRLVKMVVGPVVFLTVVVGI